MLKKYTYAELKQQFENLNYKWFNFHLVGVRSKENQKNKFDDLIGYVKGNNVSWFEGTTNAGTHWLLNLMNPKGTAHLKPNQYIDTWKIGLHNNKYKGLVQVKNVEVFRDANKNDLAEESKVIDKGLFGINIHRANSSFVSKLVDRHSAGCQVLNNPADFNKLMFECNLSNLTHFTYTLLNEF